MLATTPYRIVRDHGLNRFEATESCLRSLAARGFAPSVVIDAGAHIGSFSTMTSRVFKSAAYHLIDPQPSCREALRTLCAARGWHFHACAISDRNGRAGLRLTREFDTGAYLTEAPDDEVIEVRTLDDMFGASLEGTSALLKLDLQGHEVRALRGGAHILKSVDVVLTEVVFFTQAEENTIAELVALMAAHGFHLHDVAALAGRARDNRLHGGDFVFARDAAPISADTRWS